MEKLNNRGFAISTVLYGLLVVMILLTTLLMGTMSFTRKNNKDFTDNIKNSLENNITIVPLLIVPSVKINGKEDGKCYAGETCNYEITLKVMGKDVTMNSGGSAGVAYKITSDGNPESELLWGDPFSIKENGSGDNYQNYKINYDLTSDSSFTNAGKKLKLTLNYGVFTTANSSVKNDSYDIDLGTIEESIDKTSPTVSMKEFLITGGEQKKGYYYLKLLQSGYKATFTIEVCDDTNTPILIDNSLYIKRFIGSVNLSTIDLNSELYKIAVSSSSKCVSYRVKDLDVGSARFDGDFILEVHGRWRDSSRNETSGTVIFGGETTHTKYYMN